MLIDTCEKRLHPSLNHAESPVKNGFAACEPFFTGCAKPSLIMARILDDYT
jgi:hypothetical protein